MSKPTVNRIINRDGSSMTLTRSMMSKVDEPCNKELVIQIYGYILINGVQYCRPHLLTRCHLCEKEYGYFRDAANEERRELGLRRGGDTRVDEFSKKWVTLVAEKHLLIDMEDNLARMYYGKYYFKENPHKWKERCDRLDVDERNINDELFKELQDLKERGVGQCCYWDCKNPDSENLLTCSGCKFHKYCCKEHQLLDWKWEHRAECKANVPQYVLDKMEATHQRYLAGDYTFEL